MKTEIVEADDAFALGTVGCVVVMVWTGVPTRARLGRATDFVVRHAARNAPQPIGVVNVVEDGAPVPEPGDAELVIANGRCSSSREVARGRSARSTGSPSCTRGSGRPWSGSTVSAAVRGTRGSRRGSRTARRRQRASS